MEIKGKDLKLDPAEIEENKKKAEERFSLFKSYGYDRHKSQAFLIKKVGPIKGPVLEIGTGKGYMAAQLAKKAPSLLTVDISKEEQRLAVLNIAAESGLEQVGFLVCDAAKLPYPDKKFDDYCQLVYVAEKIKTKGGE